MSPRTREWLSDLISRLIIAGVLYLALIFGGAPVWAAFGFAAVIYLLLPHNYGDC